MELEREDFESWVRRNNPKANLAYEEGYTDAWVAGAWAAWVQWQPSLLTHTANKKLQSLQSQGYKVNGVAIRRDEMGLIPRQGFVTDYGFVGWWPGDAP